MSAGQRFVLYKRVFSFGACFYLLFIISSVLYNSSASSNSLNISLEETSTKEMPPKDIQSGGLQLEDFYRRDIKNGVKNWEIWGSNALYEPNNKTTQLENSKIRLYRPDKTVVELRSDTALVKGSSNELASAQLDSNIEVKLYEENGDLRVVCYSDDASYDAKKKLIKSAGKVKVEGGTYTVDAIGMVIKIDSERIDLLKNVKSEFITTN